MMERDGHKTTSAMSICGPMKAIRRHLCEDRRGMGEEGLVSVGERDSCLTKKVHTPFKSTKPLTFRRLYAFRPVICFNECALVIIFESAEIYLFINFVFPFASRLSLFSPG